MLCDQPPLDVILDSPYFIPDKTQQSEDIKQVYKYFWYRVKETIKKLKTKMNKELDYNYLIKKLGILNNKVLCPSLPFRVLTWEEAIKLYDKTDSPYMRVNYQNMLNRGLYEVIISIKTYSYSLDATLKVVMVVLSLRETEDELIKGRGDPAFMRRVIRTLEIKLKEEDL